MMLNEFSTREDAEETGVCLTEFVSSKPGRT